MVKRSLIRGLKAMFAAQSISLLSKGLLIVLLTRYFLTAEEYGLLFFAISILSVTLLFANLGLAKSAARYLAEYRKTDPSQVPHILWSTLKYNLGTIVVVSAAVVLFSDPIARLLDEPRVAPLLVAGVGYIAFSSLKTFVSLSFQGLNSVDWSAKVDIVANVSFLVFIVGLLYLGLGPLGAILGYTVGYALAVVVGFGVLYFKFFRPLNEGSSKEDGLSKRILRYSAPLTVTRGAVMLDSRVDAILVGYFLNPVAVGFYMLGKQITDFVIAPATTIGFSISPTYGEQKATDKLERAASLYETTFEYVVTLYIPAAVGMAILAEPTVRLVFGEGYLGAVPVVQVFSLYVLLRAIDKITNDSLDFIGRAGSRAYAKSATAVANFVLNIALIPTFGVVGAALATVITYVFLVGFEVYLIYTEFSLSLTRLARTTAIVCLVTLGMAIPVLAFEPFISGLATLAVAVGLGIALWSVFASASGLLSFRRVVSMLR
ncbi:polysaccharide biosynthesis protein [Haloferax profundi]|uniref:Polysaccharide biosynthesis protein n=2 Tax=Haloferax profundi TaxID=1544718 RepID=A0A0W1SMC4_9EURY|nr:polysaccharide biosynthesis protein [Haloferax profundi]